MTRHALLEKIMEILAGHDFAMKDARQLVAAVCDCAPEELVTQSEKPVSPRCTRRALKLARNRSEHTPMAYLLGYRDFFGRRFRVSKDVLIPRPETEHMVEEALTYNSKKTLYIDIGTGSGAIAITLAAETGQPTIATDISPQATRVARRNARPLGVESLVELKRGHLLDAIKPSYLSGFDTVVITANLPYLTPKLLTDSPVEVTHYEPPLALISDQNDGLALYRELLGQFAERRNQFPANTTILLEIDPRQKDLIEPMVRKILPDASITIKPDLAGHPRVVIIS